MINYLLPVQNTAETDMVSIHGKELSKSFYHREVIKSVSIEVGEGECFALFGPNGAGKTTLLRIIATVYRPSSGELAIMGYDSRKEKVKAREQLFLISHGSHLYDDLNVEENIQFTLGLRGMVPGGNEVKTALDRVGIGAFSKMKARFLSAGMKKRLSIAKALLIRPKVLLLDEAYASLDEQGVAMLNDAILEFNKGGAAVLVTTHDRSSVLGVVHRAGVLKKSVFKELTRSDLMEDHALF